MIKVANRTRLGLYLKDEKIKRQIKVAAAKRGMTVTAYCTQAIEEYLIRDSDMTRTVEYGANHKVSPATIKLLIAERNKGKSLRQVGQMFGRSGERIRKLLYDRPEVRLPTEKKVAARLGYPTRWLVRLRKEGLVKPVKYQGWRYSEEQVRQIPSLIAQTRRCERCGRPRPFQSAKYCSKECRQYLWKHR